MRIIAVLILFLILALDFMYISLHKRETKQKTLVTYPELAASYMRDKELLQKYSSPELTQMLDAGKEVTRWHKILAKTKATVVSELLNNSETTASFTHFPKGDVIDPEHRSQYYYHLHSPHKRGHFHLFFRPDSSVSPLVRSTEKVLFAHLIGISMNDEGIPEGLFTTNQWVTNESWFSLDELEKMIQQFQIHHVYPSWATNQWLGAMLQLFRPQICCLWKERNQQIEHHRQKEPSKDVFTNRELEITSKRPISVEQQIEVIQDILQERNLSNS